MEKYRGYYFDSETQFYTYLRSQLRKIWARHPTRSARLIHDRYQLVVNGRKVYHINCAVCGEPTPQKDIQVDHMEPCGSATDPEFASRMLDVCMFKLRSVCKECHGAITYAERYNMTIEEARIEKQVIAFAKLPAVEQLKLVEGNNLETRKEAYRATLTK